VPTPQSGNSSGLRTVLFTDVVENTALLRRIGDEGWRVVMREHEEIVRAALKEHGGTEISTSGDGFFASFGSSVRALQCAIEMQRAFARRNETAEHVVEVRIGLNAGEPIADGKEVLGTAVTMAARVMSQAGAGEVLVSDVVRQLVAGKGFLFADRGDFVAKGFEEPVRVYEVAWRQE
jgi:adenylate cyclase